MFIFQPIAEFNPQLKKKKLSNYSLGSMFLINQLYFKKKQSIFLAKKDVSDIVV